MMYNHCRVDAYSGTLAPAAVLHPAGSNHAFQGMKRYILRYKRYPSTKHAPSSTGCSLRIWMHTCHVSYRANMEPPVLNLSKDA